MPLILNSPLNSPEDSRSLPNIVENHLLKQTQGQESFRYIQISNRRVHPKTQEAAVKGFNHQLLEENNPVKSKECSIKDQIAEKHLEIAVQTIKQMNRFPACPKSH